MGFDDYQYYEFSGARSPTQKVVETKVNPAYQSYVVWQDNPTPIPAPRNYQNYAKEGYRGDDTLFKVVNYIAINGAGIPPVLYADASQQKEIKSHPLLEKLDQPNIEQSGVEYREAVIGYYLIAGTSYQYANRKGIKGPPDELWTLQPDKMKAIPSTTRGIIGYEYSDFPKERNPIDPLNIGRMKSWAPDDPLYGVSQVEVAALLIDQQTAAHRWNLGMLQNFGKSSGTWIAPTVLAPNDYAQTLAKMREMYAGFANAGKAQLLDGDMRWVQQGMAPTDMDWLKGIQYNAAAIANVFNIAPQLVGDTSASTYDNMEHAKAASYTEAIFPILDKLYALWNTWLLPMYGIKGAYLSYDKESVEVVQAVIQAQKTERAKRADDAWMKGKCTLNEAREMSDLPKQPGGDVYRFGAVLVRASELDAYAEQSLKTPAAPPSPVPENILDMPPTPTPEQGQNNATDNADNHTNNTGSGNTPNRAADDQTGKETSTQKHLALSSANTQTAHNQSRHSTTAQSAEEKRVARKQASGDTTHLLWECMAGACPFCSDNDGAIVAIGDAFPNGVESPEECHRFCKCQAWELSLPADANPDDLSQDDAMTFVVGFIASRHDQDVADQQQEEDDTSDESDLEYAKTIQIEQARERRRRKEEYRTFKEALV